MAARSHTGSLKTGTPGAAEQAAAIGATIGPDGWWYKNGKKLSPQEADALTNAAGVGVTSTDDAHGAKSHGWVGDTYGRNESWMKPLAVGAASILGSPALGAAVAGGLNYTKNHDLGKAAVDAGLTYGGGKLLSGAGKVASKIPGVSAAGDAVKRSSLGQAVSNTGDFLSKTGTNVADAFKPVVAGAERAGFKIPSLADLVGAAGRGLEWLTGNNGMNALGVAQGINAADLMRQSTGFANQAKDLGLQNWKSRQPLRDKGLAGLTAPVAPDLSQLERQRTAHNPFAVRAV